MYVALLETSTHLTLVPDYSKLPTVPNVDIVYLLDPLIATGGTAAAAMHMLLDWGVPGACPIYLYTRDSNKQLFAVTKIKLLCILASQDGLKRVHKEFPELEVRRGLPSRFTTSHIPPDLGSGCRS